MSIVFYCDGGPEQGFGHVSRCIILAGILEQDSSCGEITFCGNYAAAVLERIRQGCPGANILAGGSFPSAKVAVVDRMTNKWDPSDWDGDFLAAVRRASEAVVHIGSGIRGPAPAGNMICLGYQPFAQLKPQQGLHWGLEFAPVPPGLREIAERCPDRNRAFVGIGGGGAAHSLKTVLSALDGVDQVHTIDVLVSPVAEYDLSKEVTEKPVTLYRNVPSVAPLLARAGLVIASHGNLLFEALALGAPVCVVGQKDFQAEYGEQFEEMGLAVSGGILGSIDSRSLTAQLEKALRNSEQLSAKAFANIDDRGLIRTAMLINEQFKSNRPEPECPE
jgi:spore coat polysaccharide biosynthesis predicted glycosyltransferase SpsG